MQCVSRHDKLGQHDGRLSHSNTAGTRSFADANSDTDTDTKAGTDTARARACP